MRKRSKKLIFVTPICFSTGIKELGQEDAKNVRRVTSRSKVLTNGMELVGRGQRQTYGVGMEHSTGVREVRITQVSKQEGTDHPWSAQAVRKRKKRKQGRVDLGCAHTR